MRDDDFYLAFGRQVAARRLSLGKSQKDVASEVGLSRASIANIERGRQAVLLHQVYALASALEMQSAADILPIRPSPHTQGEVLVPMTGVSPGSHQAAQVASLVSLMSQPANRGKK